MKIQNLDLDKLRNDFLRNIGGQTHVQCRDYELHLVASTAREDKCSKCGRPDYMKYCKFNCTVF